jgi:polyhydroxybutyrate depolymerase
MRILFFSATCLFLTLLSSCSKKNYDTNVDHSIGTFSRSIEVEGETREYLIYVPNTYDTIQSFPLMLNFHGWTMSARNQMEVSDMRALSETDEFILVYPQGTRLWGSTHWNVGSWTLGSNAKDVEFIAALINQIADNYNIDDERVYACGYSNGGFFSHELACQLSQKIAAIGTVAANISEETINNCNPSHPIPIITISGTRDDEVEYDGSIPERTLSQEETLEYWRTFNKVDTVPIITNMPDLNSLDGSTAVRYQYVNGDNDSEVEHYKVVDGGHDWPGTFGNMDINSDSVIWNFVSQFDINGKR